jgi:hypothetical protein
MYGNLKSKLLLAFTLSSTAIFSVAFADPSTSAYSSQVQNSQASLDSRGLWQDPKTKLIWSRCSFGQIWTGRECTGTPEELSWKSAKEAAKSAQIDNKKDWRLPTLYELKSLKLRTAGNPETNSYPWFYKPDGADGYGWYWSSTPYSYFGGTYAWAVDLDMGKGDYIDKEHNLRLFLVREPSPELVRAQ